MYSMVFIVLGLGDRGWGLGAWGWGWGVGVFNPSLSKAMLPMLSNPGTVYDKKFAPLSGFYPEYYKKKDKLLSGLLKMLCRVKRPMPNL